MLNYTVKSFMLKYAVMNHRIIILNDMTADCIMININLQNRNARINKVKEYKKITVSLSRFLQLNN